MNQVPANVRKDLLKIVPLAILNDVTCFSFYDNHPLDCKEIDVIVCTNRGEIQEFYKRNIGLTFLLPSTSINEIKLLRNSRCDLFYLVKSENKLVIFKRDDNLILKHEINNFATYELEDNQCAGKVSLKIFQKDVAVALLFDDKFEALEKIVDSNKDNQSEDSFPLLLQLKRKLSEAQYCVKYNESRYKELLELRQKATFDIYRSCSSDPKHSLCEANSKEMEILLQIETKTPEIILCNSKIVIILSVSNKNDLPLEDVHIFLHSSHKKSISNTVKVYKRTLQSPYWKEQEDCNIQTNSEYCIIAVMNLTELLEYTYSTVKFEVVLAYVKEGKSLMLPYNNIVMSIAEIMGENFDILSSEKNETDKIILSIMSSCEKTQVQLKHVMNNADDVVTPFEIFCGSLKMKLLMNEDNVAIHNSSPYHVLHGVMVIWTNIGDHVINIEVYARSPTQVLALIHYIYDAVPYRILATTADIKISSTQDVAKDEETDRNDKLNLMDLGKSLVYQTTILKKYLDDSLIKMNECKDPLIQSKIGKEILVSSDPSKFLELRQKVLDSTETGISGLNKDIEETSMDIDE